jgi:hypothetical protein
LKPVTLVGKQLFLSVGDNLSLALDEDGSIWQNDGGISALSMEDGALSIIDPATVTEHDIIYGWSAGPPISAPIGRRIYACYNTTQYAYQLYAIASIPDIRCTAVAIQVTP